MVAGDDVTSVQPEELRKLSRNLVEQAAKETLQEAKAINDSLVDPLEESLVEVANGVRGGNLSWMDRECHARKEPDVLEQWNPDQVYQRALTWVGEELQEQLLEGFFQGATPDYVDIHQFIEYLRSRGLSPLIDPRLKDFISAVSTKPDTRYSYSNIRQHIPHHEFKSIVLKNPTILSAIKGEFVVEDFPDLVQAVDEIFEDSRSASSGRVTTYIPSLAQYPADRWAASICTTDGQVHVCGDADDLVTLQSVTKPIFYGICLDEIGEERVHEKVGKEPSGHGFNKITLARDNKAHNPLINTGSITLASLYQPDQPMSARYKSVMSKYQAMVEGSGQMLHFNNTVYLSELDNGHRNYAIGYYLKSKGCLKEKVNLKETLELYFQLCSIETSVRNASIMAAALANGGRNVYTGKQIISERSVQNMLSIMFSCGMYDYSGEWAFEVGIPAKSGVSGLIIVVIPDVMGLALWSPPLDSYGNSVRGVHFAREMVKRYSHGRNQNVLHPFSNRKSAEVESRILNTFQPFPARQSIMDFSVPATGSRRLHTSAACPVQQANYTSIVPCNRVGFLRGIAQGLRMFRR